MPYATGPEQTPEATTTQAEPFSFAPIDQYTAGARSVAALWSMPLRAMMVVMSEAVGTTQR